MSETREWRMESPAKINLFLAVTGLREDGFHDLVSLVTPITLYDTLTLKMGEGKDRLEVEGISVPTDDSNLVLKAVKTFRKHWNPNEGFQFKLHKKIPIGGGLGGGSSNAVAALKLINQVCPNPLEFETLFEIAAEIGSDCPLFLYDDPVVMRGRGELIQKLSTEQIEAIRKIRFTLFKPTISISTPWAYGELKKNKSYLSATEVELMLERFLGSPEKYLYNSFESVVFRKYLSMGLIINDLRNIGVPALMSGSGSVCFLLHESHKKEKDVKNMLTHAWGEDSILGNYTCV